MTTPSAATTGSGDPQVITAARFRIQADTWLVAGAFFAELGGITSEVESSEYITTNPDRPTSVVHSRQFGKTKPPTITLKRGVDGGGDLWAWHRAARLGQDSCRVGATLTVMNAAGEHKGSYELANCWPTKVDVSGLKAGASEVVYETVTLTCDDITYYPPSAKPPRRKP